jgi:hypothetical protein
MHGRIGRIALVLFQALWLNVILPGHTRGIITLPGTACADGPSSCCLRKAHVKSHLPAKPAPRPGSCAVCFFAARLSTPDFIDLTPPPLGLLTTASIPPSQSLYPPSLVLAFDSRGPPAV